MIERYRAYTDMKDSGTKWFGHVPEHWAYIPLFAVTSPKSVTNCPNRELLSVYLNRGVVLFSDIAEKRTNATSSDLSKYQAVDPGDFVLNNQQAWRGSVGVSKYAGIVSPAYLVLSLSSALHPQYANYLFRDEAMVNQYLVCSKGVGSIQRNLYWPHLKRVTTLVPPIDEQVAIAGYLHQMDLKITRFISNRRRLIEVLNEQKQGIINRAVTRGLDPDAPLKALGIGFLRNIPEHWVVKPMKRWVSINERVLPETTDPEYTFDYLDIGCVGTGRLLRKPSRIKFRDAPSRARRILGRGDTIISTVRTYLRSVYFFGEGVSDVVASTGFAVLTPREGIVPEYLGITLQSDPFINRVTASSIGIAYPAISETRLGKFHVALPPHADEQQAIVEQVRSHTAAISARIERAQSEIELIREYRTRLISDVVTGKVDVRHLAPLKGNEDLEDMAEVIEPLEDVIDYIVMDDDEEDVNESD